MNNGLHKQSKSQKCKGRHYHIKRRSKPGASPGTLIVDPQARVSILNLIEFNDDHIKEYKDCSLAIIRDAYDSKNILWIQVNGLGNLELIKELGAIFGLHNLALEDVINHHQRPKTEEYADHVFITTRMLLDNQDYDTEQVSLFLGKNYVIIFQENKRDCFEPVRVRLRAHKGQIRQSGADYLAYALLDAIIDNYFPVLERLGEEIEICEENVINRPHQSSMTQLHDLKHELLNLRRAVWPQREMLNFMVREDSVFIQEHTRIYLRDCYDHIIQLMDIIETYREIASGLIDIYLSSLSYQMNEIMKVLTVIATIFIPLSFIAGLYGMNFDRSSPWNMPELGWRFGYPITIALMLIITGGLLYYFRRKGWLENASAKKKDKAE